MGLRATTPEEDLAMLIRKLAHVALAGLAASSYLACAGTDENPPGTGGSTGIGGSSGAGAGGSAGAGQANGGASGAGSGGTMAGTGGAGAAAGAGTGGTAGNAGSGGSSGASSGTGGSVAGAGGAASGSAGTAGSGVGGGGTAGSGTAGAGAGGNSAGAGAGGKAGGGSTAPCTGPGSLETGDSAHSLTVGGTEYPVNLHVPDSYDGVARMPVVFDFHGLGGNEDQMQRLSGWAATGDAEGFITVFPGGPDNGWNAGGLLHGHPHRRGVRPRVHPVPGHRGVHRHEAHLRLGLLQWRRDVVPSRL
jgi:hypothetical protein